jgi:protein arginine N-methyltransferase 1
LFVALSSLVNVVNSKNAIVWDNVYGFDFSCIKDIALREPLVDTVELKAVATDPCILKVCRHLLVSSPKAQNRTYLYTIPTIIQRIDLTTAKKEDLTFSAPFELLATRTDCM